MAKRPAFYAAKPGKWRDWWTLLHPPYTGWHLSYVVIGAALAPCVNQWRLIATVVAFFLAVGVSAHALDELHGRPLNTRISSRALVISSVVALSGAVALGAAGIVVVGWSLIPFIVLGPILVVAYNAELLGGIVHTDVGFALAWGSFPLLTAYVAQSGTLSIAAVLAAIAAFAISSAQRALSTPTRFLRRKVGQVHGNVTLVSGELKPISLEGMLMPLEAALRCLSWGMVILATAMAVGRLA